MARFCANCGSAMDDNAGFCAKCGQAVAGATGAGATAAGGAAAATAPAATTGLTDNVAGMLAYVTFIPAIIFLVVEPYNKNRFVRFHAFQCIFLTIFLVVLNIALGFVPILGWALSGLVGLAVLVLWILLLIKAYNGQKWKLPVIGDMAEKQANSV